MKRAFAILSLLAIIFANLYQLTLIGIYTIEKDYFTKVFCINKDKPELKCNGKCHLKKNLFKAENKQSNNTKSTIEIQILSPVFWEQTTITLPKLNTYKTYYFTKVLSLKDTYLFSSLDPPQYS